MDSLITAAARALARGDPLGALDRVALRDDAAALALRGIAMAQLGDLERARVLVRRAARAFGARETVARARCLVAEAEIAFAARDLAWPADTLERARSSLEAHGDHLNAIHAGFLQARRLILLGRLDDGERHLAGIDPGSLPASWRALYELLMAGIAMRRLRAGEAGRALDRAGAAARRAGVPALRAEVDGARRQLLAPAARLKSGNVEHPVDLAQVERLLASGRVVIDACRQRLIVGPDGVDLAQRPVLFALLQTLGEAWPGEATRSELMWRAFRIRQGDDTLRARLRVEIGRLRKLLRPVAAVRAAGRGFALIPHEGRAVAVIVPPVDARFGAVFALLSDGEAWSSSALALALDVSQRTVQRALDGLAASGRVESFGRGRARRWITAPVPGFATTLLLPAPLPTD